MSDIIRNAKQYIAEKMDMTVDELDKIRGIAKHISTSGDCKVALSNMIIANRNCQIC